MSTVIQRANFDALPGIPEDVRNKFLNQMDETFAPNEPPIEFNYSTGKFIHEGSEFSHKLEVTFVYWDGYEWVEDYVNFLVK